MLFYLVSGGLIVPVFSLISRSVPLKPTRGLPRSSCTQFLSGSVTGKGIYYTTQTGSR